MELVLEKIYVGPSLAKGEEPKGEGKVNAHYDEKNGSSVDYSYTKKC